MNYIYLHASTNSSQDWSNSLSAKRVIFVALFFELYISVWIEVALSQNTPKYHVQILHCIIEYILVYVTQFKIVYV